MMHCTVLMPKTWQTCFRKFLTLNRLEHLPWRQTSGDFNRRLSLPKFEQLYISHFHYFGFCPIRLRRTFARNFTWNILSVIYMHVCGRRDLCLFMSINEMCLAFHDLVRSDVLGVVPGLSCPTLWLILAQMPTSISAGAVAAHFAVWRVYDDSLSKRDPSSEPCRIRAHIVAVPLLMKKAIYGRWLFTIQDG